MMKAKDIPRRRFLKSAAVGAIGAALVASTGFGNETKRPNFVILMTDDQRWDAMSCAGNKILRTPNMDRLAKEGVRFENAFVTNSLCTPSRATVLTGLYSHTHGVIDNKGHQIEAD
ncbi:MAG TPA: sulfatase-like hydrolase/transferase, partial [bacterium]|nr:sulfatase-like hydrolase/transferase [bacterium]